MRIFFIVPVLIFSLFSVFVTFTSAQESNLSVEPSSTPSASVADSFDLFWPLSAGKTESDSFYSLKLLKEQVRGWFILGDVRKADYEVLLGTKRVLEAEKLLKEGKTNLALKTLGRADSEFTSAYSHIKKADSKGELSTGEIRKDRLINVRRLIDYLKIVIPEEVRLKLDGVKESADKILRDYLP